MENVNDGDISLHFSWVKGVRKNVCEDCSVNYCQALGNWCDTDNITVLSNHFRILTVFFLDMQHL